MAQKPKQLKNKRINITETRTKVGKRIDFYDGKKEIKKLGFGDSFYIPNFIKTKKEKDEIFKKLVNEVEFDQMFYFKEEATKAFPIPRLVIAQCDKNVEQSPIYRMPGCNERNIGTTQWTPTVKYIRDKAASFINEELNHCVVTLYRNNEDSLGFHKDKLIDLKENSLILSISFGAPRPIIFRANRTQIIMLQPGSLLAIGFKTNKVYQHTIPKQNQKIGPRISLSMRTIASYKNNNNNVISGKGKEWQTLNYPFIKSNDDITKYSNEVVEKINYYKIQTKKYLIDLRKELNFESEESDDSENNEINQVYEINELNEMKSNE